MHLGAAGAVYDPAAQIVRMLSRLFSFVHDFLNLLVCLFTDDRRKGVLDANGVRLGPTVYPVLFLVDRVQIRAGVLFVPQDLID